jgi:hypothetical protein
MTQANLPSGRASVLQALCVGAGPAGCRSSLLGAPAFDRREVGFPAARPALGVLIGELGGSLEHIGRMFERRSQRLLEIARRYSGRLGRERCGSDRVLLPAVLAADARAVFGDVW